MEEIVKTLNNFIKHNYGINGKFIQHKSYKVNPSFKSLKTYILCLYYVNNGKTYPMIEEEITVKEVDGNAPEKEINSKFLEAVFDYVASEEFKDLVNGKLNI